MKTFRRQRHQTLVERALRRTRQTKALGQQLANTKARIAPQKLKSQSVCLDTFVNHVMFMQFKYQYCRARFLWIFGLLCRTSEGLGGKNLE